MTMTMHKKLALCLVFVLIGAMLLGTGVTTFASEGPQRISGNDPGFLEGCKVLKVDPPVSGNYTVDEGVYIRVNFSNDGKSVSFTSDIGITHVFVKGGNAGNLYSYDSAVNSDSNLIAPNNKGGQQPQISHVSFYICDSDTSDPNPVQVVVSKMVIDNAEQVITDDAEEFTVTINGASEVFSVNTPATFSLLPGSYAIAEGTISNSDYTFVDITGDGITESDSGYSLTISDTMQGPVAVTITNLYSTSITNPQTGTLRVVKVVEGTENTTGTFNITVTPDDEDADTKSGQVSAALPAEFANLTPGWYTVTENSLPTNYQLVSMDPVDGRVEVTAGETVTVTITNRYTDTVVTPQTGTLRVVKVVEGTDNTTDTFNITVTPDDEDADTKSGQVSAALYAEFGSLTPGWYTVTENSLPANYQLVGMSPAGGRIEVKANETVVVTITNRYSSTNGYVNPYIPVVVETEDPSGGDPETEVVVDPEPANGGDPETEIDIPAEPAGAGGGELPQTSGTDILYLGLGAILASGGFVIRRRQKK